MRSLILSQWRLNNYNITFLCALYLVLQSESHALLASSFYVFNDFGGYDRICLYNAVCPE